MIIIASDANSVTRDSAAAASLLVSSDAVDAGQSMVSSAFFPSQAVMSSASAVDSSASIRRGTAHYNKEATSISAEILNPDLFSLVTDKPAAHASTAQPFTGIASDIIGVSASVVCFAVAAFVLQHQLE